MIWKRTSLSRSLPPSVPPYISEASCHHRRREERGYLSSSEDGQRSNAEPFGGERRSTLNAAPLDFQSIPCKAPLHNRDQPPSRPAHPSVGGDPAWWWAGVQRVAFLSPAKLLNLFIKRPLLRTSHQDIFNRLSSNFRHH